MYRLKKKVDLQILPEPIQTLNRDHMLQDFESNIVFEIEGDFCKP